MTEELYIEAGGYAIRFYTSEEGKDSWTSWASFERIDDVLAKLELIPAVRRRTPETFARQADALQGAEDYAERLIASGTVGL